MLVACVGQVRVLAGEAEGKRCAVIASAECEQAGIGDLLTAKLSAIESVELVERALVRKVLAEHGLTAAGLASPQGAIQLGKLLSADAFLVVERVPKATPPACRLQVIETRTGVALGMELLAEESLAKDIAPVARLLRSSAARLGVPLEKRHYVGLLGFRSEELGRALDGLAEALGMLLMTDLAKSPGVVVLDREHLDALTKESGLTGVQLQLKTSATLIDGAVKRLPGEKKLGATILLRPLAGGAEQRVSVSVPEGDIGGPRQRPDPAGGHHARAGSGDLRGPRSAPELVGRHARGGEGRRGGPGPASNPGDAHGRRVRLAP